MIKKIIPIVALIGASALIVGMSNEPTKKTESFYSNINAFENDVNNYINTNANLSSASLNKYLLTVETPNIDNNESNIVPTLEETTESETNSESDVISENDEDTEITESFDQSTIQEISTLYSLSDDIENSCDDFCELKKDIADAIIETQNLINKVQQNEIKLTNEQRLFINEQAQQLKSLGRQLSNITTELSFNLNDINQIMATNGDNIDNLSLKYLIVLDNLVNGNEMLQIGLNSLNTINQMFNMNATEIPPNNTGRILYGFRHNNNPPVIKDYYFDENGNLVENNQSTEQIENNSSNNESVEAVGENTKKSNIDTYQNSNLNTNLDTYYNNNQPRNIDSFFNTALLDNDFMYGNGYGYGGVNGMYNMNPYMQNYANYQNNQSSYGVYQNENTQDINKETNQSNKTKKEKKRFELKKNIDTFKDENEPDIKTKLGNIKNSISGFFGKFKKSDMNEKIDNPVYRYNPSENQENS